MTAWKNFNSSNLIKDSLRVKITRVKIFQVARKEGKEGGKEGVINLLWEKEKFKKSFASKPSKTRYRFLHIYLQRWRKKEEGKGNLGHLGHYFIT